MKPYYEGAGITIYHADARDVLPHLTADVLVTDPPYGIAYESGRPGTTEWQGKQIANDDDTSARDAVLAAWGDRPALVFGSWKRPRPAATRMVLIWDKGPALGMGALDLPWKPSWEEIYVLGRGFTGRRDGGVLSCPPVQSLARNGRVHSNQKPLPLLLALLQKCPAGVVLDPFMGSGTTLRAAKDLGRRAIGVDVDERCCELAALRLSQEVMRQVVAPEPAALPRLETWPTEPPYADEPGRSAPALVVDAAGRRWRLADGSLAVGAPRYEEVEPA